MGNSESDDAKKKDQPPPPPPASADSKSQQGTSSRTASEANGNSLTTTSNTTASIQNGPSASMAPPVSNASLSAAPQHSDVVYGDGGNAAAPSTAPVSGPDAKPPPHPVLTDLPPAQSLVAGEAPSQGSWYGPQRPPPRRLTRDAIAQTALMWQKPPIGKGGFSSVHEGIFFNTPAAVKVLTLRDQSERDMFNEELRALLNPALWHPNITPLLGYCDTDPAFVFPRLVPISQERLARLPLPVRDYICRDAALGLAHMHSAGYVHSDMKPDNVLLDFDQNRVIRRALVGDMGCVKSCAVPVMPFGTIIYMDPCMTGGVLRYPHPMDDVFALGVTFLAIFSGVIPKTLEDVARIDDTLARTDPFRSQVARSMMQPNRAARPSCNAVAATLQSVIARQGVTPPLPAVLLPSPAIMQQQWNLQQAPPPAQPIPPLPVAAPPQQQRTTPTVAGV